MNRLSRVLMGLVAAGALTVSANAADLPVKAKPVATVIWTWTGLYFGGHVGAGWGTTETALTSFFGPAVPPGSFNFPFDQNSRSGFLGGGQVGYNYQSGWVVVGVQGDIAGMDVKGTTPCVVVLSCTSKSDWLATVSGRVGGVAGERTLLYIKGGAAWLHSNQSASAPIVGQLTSAESTAVGALLGMGVEYAFSAHLTGFLEYNYMEFQGKNVSFPLGPAVIGAGVNANVVNKLSIAKAGVNYKF